MMEGRTERRKDRVMKGRKEGRKKRRKDRERRIDGG